MQLSDIRNEILNHGFDPVLFGLARVNQYINDAQFLICRRVNYYVEEAAYSFSTVAGTASYAWPAALARVRELFDPTRNVTLAPVSIRDIDRSSASRGAPSFWAVDGANVHLYPVPDGVYSLELRYWALPTTLANDSDVPTIPADWHHLLWVYGCALCYEAEDDAQMAQYFMQRFNTELAEFAADQKFPSVDLPTQVSGMWEQDRALGASGWSLWIG